MIPKYISNYFYSFIIIKINNNFKYIRINQSIIIYDNIILFLLFFLCTVQLIEI